jgi:hypothetical protein
MYGDGPRPFLNPKQKEFKPWHKPRKQYVRREQWLREVSSLLGDIVFHDESFRYLTLPGEDLLDIRYLHDEVFSPKKIKLCYSGFLLAPEVAPDEDIRLNIEQHATRIELDFIDDNSKVHLADIREITRENSLRGWNLKNDGPFHAINLDLCNGIAGKEKGEGMPNYFDALSTLMKYQTRTKDDFVLLITTRIDEQCVAPDFREKIERIINTYCTDCESYISQLKHIWSIAEVNPHNELIEKTGRESVFLLGLSLWIIDVGAEYGFAGHFSDIMTYRVRGNVNHDDIASISIRFSQAPRRIADSFEFANVDGDENLIRASKCEQAEQTPALVNEQKCVDSILERNSNIYTQCVDETVKLMEGAGYEGAAYRNWLERSK